MGLKPRRKGDSTVMEGLSSSIGAMFEHNETPGRLYTIIKHRDDPKKVYVTWMGYTGLEEGTDYIAEQAEKYLRSKEWIRVN